MGVILPSAGRPAERATAQHVEVGMAYGLTALEAGIGHEAMTRAGDPLLPRHLGREGKHLGSERGIGLRHGGHVGEVLGRDDQDVHGSLWLDIAEGHRSLTARDDVRRDVSSGDSAEEAIAHAVILTRAAEVM